jgi:hypothetical protein
LAVVWDMSHLHWRLLIAVGTLMAGASTVGWVLWCRTADRRYAPPPSALDDLQEALTKGGWPNTVRGLSDAGHATITIETSEGPELIWCVNLDPRRTLPAESVHLMRGYLLAYSIRRGWILTEGQVSSALVEYAQRFAICVCRPRAIGVWPEEPAPSPQSPPRPASRWHVDTRAPDAPIFRAATTRRRS